MSYDDLYNSILSSIIFENSLTGITALYPGGFKPPHKGHFDLIEAYVTDPAIASVKILIGHKGRSSTDNSINISHEISEYIWNEWYMHALPTGKIETISNIDTVPVRASYLYVDLHTSPGDKIVLVSSDKSIEDSTRSQEFTNKHKKGSGKYSKEGVDVIVYPKSVVSIYNGRTDSLNGKPVSSTVMRDDIAKKDIVNFTTNLPDKVKSKANDILSYILSRQ